MKQVKKLVAVLFAVLLIVALVIFVIKFGGDSGNAAVTGIVINEVMIKNDGSVPDKFGNYFDWIELYNTSDHSIDVSSWGLSDDLTSNVKYVIPSGISIDSNGYLVIFCSGNADNIDGQLYANFKLSETDDLVLYNAGGGIVDSMDPAVANSGSSYAREQNSNTWKQMSPSPGFENSEVGIAAYAQYLSTLTFVDNPDTSLTKKSDIDYIVINELMAANSTTISDGNGEFSDWVELYNTSSKDVNLEGFFISDDITKPQKYAIPSGVTIEASSYLLIFFSGNDGLVGTELHVPFGLAAYQEDVVISDNSGAIIDSVSYSKLETDCSYARTPNITGDFSSTDKPTPNYENTEEAFSHLASAYQPMTPIYISEMMGQNSSKYSVTTSDGRTVFCDWVEITNSSSNEVDISGYGLSTNPKNPAKFLFPQGTKIKANGILVILLSNNANYVFDESVLRAKFNLSAAGETIYLFDSGGKFIDKLYAEKFIADMSIGREADYTIRYYYSPTPGSINGGESTLGLCSAPSFVTVPGVYNDTVSVELSCRAGEQIYYTTDCSTPTSSSALYTDPITISNNTVIRAVCYHDGYCSSYSEATGTYLFSSDNVNHTLPIISLVTDEDNLWNLDSGIYTYGRKWQEGHTDSWPYWQTPANFWNDWERKASFEVFSDDENMQVFQQNIGISISGAFGRGREQKGIAIIARDEYGDNRMDYPFFEDLPYTSYKSLLLRCGAQDQSNGKIRDVLSVSLFDGHEVNFLYQEYKPYILYLNGKYWGVYFLREKRNRFFVTQHEGIADNTDVTLIKSETRANYGTTSEWAQLMNYVRTHDLTNSDAYEYISERIDLNSFMDYIICEIYVGNTDYWNIQMYKAGDGKYKFIYYDFCWGWNSYSHKTVAARRAASQPCSDFFNALLKVPSWREAFLHRFDELMDTVYAEDWVLQNIDELDSLVRSEIERERSMFNSASSPYFSYVDPSNFSSYNTYVTHIEKIRDFAKNRRASILEQLQSEFNLSDEYMNEIFG